MKIRQRILMLVACILLSADAMAVGGFKPTPQEIKMLPPYCASKAERYGDSDKARMNQWKQVFGEANYSHYHHYCKGLLHINRSRQPGYKRNSELNAAIHEIEYSEKASTPDFVLLPEMLLNKASALEQLGRDGEAVALYLRVIDMKKDFIMAYAALSDFYKKRGDKEKASKAIRDGLAVKPDSKLLTDRLDRLQVE